MDQGLSQRPVELVEKEVEFGPAGGLHGRLWQVGIPLLSTHGALFRDVGQSRPITTIIARLHSKRSTRPEQVPRWSLGTEGISFPFHAAVRAQMQLCVSRVGGAENYPPRTCPRICTTMRTVTAILPASGGTARRSEERRQTTSGADR
jgi:hypothetical protein